MITVRGRQYAEMTANELRTLVARYDGVMLDLGTGDGAYVLRYAREHPARLAIGVDPVRENLREVSAKAAKKPERGGAPNALFVVASIEQPPPELAGIADEISITLPWGSLMRGIILAEAPVLHAIAALCAPKASLRIVLNTRIFDDPVPVEARDLPDLSPGYAHTTLAPAFAASGLRITDASWLSADEVAAIATTWAKRLSHRAPPRSLLIVATKGSSE